MDGGVLMKLNFGSENQNKLSLSSMHELSP